MFRVISNLIYYPIQRDSDYPFNEIRVVIQNPFSKPCKLQLHKMNLLGNWVLQKEYNVNQSWSNQIFYFPIADEGNYKLSTTRICILVDTDEYIKAAFINKQNILNYRMLPTSLCANLMPNDFYYENRVQEDNDGLYMIRQSENYIPIQCHGGILSAAFIRLQNITGGIGIGDYDGEYSLVYIGMNNNETEWSSGYIDGKPSGTTNLTNRIISVWSGSFNKLGFWTEAGEYFRLTRLLFVWNNQPPE